MSASPTCIPLAVGVPAAGGHPVWWDLTSGSEPNFNKRIDDPRWQGSIARTYPESGTGVATEHAIFRALQDSDASGSYLYLSWWIQVDPVLTVDTDRITIGFQNSTTGATHVIRMPAFGTVPATPTGPAPSPGATAYSASGTSGGTTPWTIASLSATPAWIGDKERSWVDSGTNSWAVHLRVPMFTASAGTAIDPTGIALGTTFKLWYEVKVTTTSGAGSIFHKWPRTAATSTGTTVPNPSQWGDFRIGGGPEDPACAAGIWIDVLNVGTRNTDSAGNPAPNLIKWSRTAPVANTFFAQPMNGTGGSVEGSDLHVRFRLANWGTQPDWNDVPNPDTLWTDILPGLNDAQGPVGPVANGSRIVVQKNWTMTTSTQPNINEFDPPATATKRPHQCMLVELSGGGLDFGRSSVYRNMDIVHASTFEREARVSVEGLGQLGSDPDRTVYLYVQALNLPENVDPKNEPPRDQPPPTGILAEGRREEPQGPWQVAQRVPTHLVHVYHDTGETYEEDDGTQRPVLRPQPSFGVFVQHDGTLYGWDHELTGDLEELAPNFYRLKVPYDGEVTVTQRVVAHERPRPTGGIGGCIAWFLGLLAAIVAFFRKLFK